MKKVLGTLTKRIIEALGLSVALCLALYLAVLCVFPFPYDALKHIKYSQCIFDRNGNLIRVFAGQDDSRLMPIDVKEINPNLVNATLAIEDNRFRSHHGVDLFAVLRAVRLNVTNQKTISGASTISMQVIRIAENRKRSYFNKAIEAVHAIRLETLYSKEEILRFYFELAPYGGNIRGVKAAALRYFKKYPQDLTLSECALLAGLPQSPSRLRPDRFPERAVKRRDRVLGSMLRYNFINKSQYQRAQKEIVAAGNYPFPFKAPLFAQFVHRKCKRPPNVVMTMDSNIQNFAEMSLKEALRDLTPDGVTNGAVVVIENSTGKIRAMVGSGDFFSTENSGQINGALRRRCPGSTLKPFTYALAFEEGLYTPNMILADVPVQYDGYAPLDFDKEFRGPVMVRDALVDSLNVPAVEVLNRLGYRKLYLFLKEAGISTLRKMPEYYGLALTLGSGEVNLLELTNAYAALARQGIYKPYRFLEADQKGDDTAKRILSEAAAYLVSDILSDTKRLEAVGIYRDSRVYPRIVWKTGTSYGHKDAWTVCYNPEYTVGVWLGNFSARPAKVLVGVDVAAPLAFKIFDSLYVKKPAPWYTAPDTIGERRVCAISGEPVGDHCPQGLKDLFIKSCGIVRPCGVHRKIEVDNETGLALDESFSKERVHTEKVFEIWPDALQSWIRVHKAEYVVPPGYLALNKKAGDFERNKPKILSPSHGCEYFIAQTQNDAAKLALLATASFDSDRLFWFIDGRFYNKSGVGERLFWTMEQGSHKITCVDGFGRSSSIMVVVR